MAGRADANMTSNRRRVQRTLQALGLVAFVALVTLAVGAVLTASGAFAGGLAASSLNSVKPAYAAYAPILTDTPTSTPNPCDPVWSVVSSPNPNPYIQYEFLRGVAAVSANDVWAVGYNWNGSAAYQRLVEHWDGSTWSLAPVPDHQPLYAVAAVSANDVWAVGLAIGHWNGTAWSWVPYPRPGFARNYLYGVAAVSANDVWAVGYYSNDGNTDYTLVEHWDGTAWSVVPSPNPGGYSNNLYGAALSAQKGVPLPTLPPGHTNILYGVAALSANDVWAVGMYDLSTLVEHWDGTAWSVVPSPSGGVLNGIAAVSANDVWAVGNGNIGFTTQTLVEHWNGTAWSVIPSPSLYRTNILQGVAAVSANDVWAVGYYYDPPPHETLVVHWDGTAWSVVPSPNPGSAEDYLYGVAAVSANDVWAMGHSVGGTLVEHFASPCSPTTTPIPTSTFTPTNTPTATQMPLLVGHVAWQGRSAQPNQLQVLPITLTLKMGATEVNYDAQYTDQNGFFTVTVGGLPNGTYNWRADDTATALHSPNYLANSGVVNLTGAPQTNLEIGLMKTGDANDDNMVNLFDFNILKVSFGFGCGDPNYDQRVDFTGDCTVNIADFNLLKNNFGQGGAPPISPGGKN